MIGPQVTFRRLTRWIPVIARLPLLTAIIGMAALLGLFLLPSSVSIKMRVPGTDQPAGTNGVATTNAVLLGKLVPGEGRPANLPGEWTGFRGSLRNGQVERSVPLARSWEPSGPRVLWEIELGEGYAGAAVEEGRVYVMDYDREGKKDALRCLSLADGKEIWRFAYPNAVKRNHGMSRTVPALSRGSVVAIGPKCHVVCLDARSGELRWGIDLVKQFGATIPPWYTGQCPLIENDRVILAPGGPDALLIALDLATGKLIWRTPNPNGWKMTHSSIIPMELGSGRSYVYCATLGVVGVSAIDGALLWQSPDWKISIATVPSPVLLGNGRLFLAGGYDAGSLFLTLTNENGVWTPKAGLRLAAETFGATQQTPIWYENHLYGVRPDGQFVCLDPNGKVLWASGPGHLFGLGSFLLADGLIFALDDGGKLSLIEAGPDKFNLLARAAILKGHESWAPMALAGDHLLARDLRQLICLEVGRRAFP